MYRGEPPPDAGAFSFGTADTIDAARIPIRRTRLGGKHREVCEVSRNPSLPPLLNFAVRGVALWEMQDMNNKGGFGFRVYKFLNSSDLVEPFVELVQAATGGLLLHLLAFRLRAFRAFCPNPNPLGVWGLGLP